MYGSGFLGLLLVVSIILPFVIDLNQMKPQIQTVVSEAVNGEIEFDSIKLTVLTGLGVKLQNVTVKNTDKDFVGTTLFHVDELVLRANLGPLLQGNFEGELLIKAPEINLVNKGARNNIASLAKPSDVTVAAETKDTDKKKMTADEKKQQEEMIEKFKKRISIKAIQIDDAIFTLQNIFNNKNYEWVRISDLDLLIENIGLEREISTKISTDVKFSDKGIQVDGPVNTNIKLFVSTQGSQFVKATYEGLLSFDQLSINAMQAFVKNKGIPLNVAFHGEVGPDSFLLSELKFNIHTVSLLADAKIEGFKELNSKFKMSLVNSDIKSLGDLLPQHKSLLSAGSFAFNLEEEGLLSDFSKVKLKASIDSKLVGADMKLLLNVKNALQPNLDLSIDSKKLDLNALLGPFLPKEKVAKESANPVQASEQVSSETPKGDPKDFVLSEAQKVLLKNADVSARIDMGEILFDNLKINNLNLDFYQKGLNTILKNFSLNIFQGKVGIKGNLDLGANPIAFKNHLQLDGIETSEIVAVVKPEHKDVLKGKANFVLDLKGSGSTVATLSKTLNGLGAFKFLDGEIQGASVSEKLNGEINSYLSGLSITGAAEGVFTKIEKVLQNPLLQKLGAGNKLNLSQYKAKYEQFSKISLPASMSGSKSLKDTDGQLEIKDGRIYITSQKNNDSGKFKMKSSVGLDLSLDGGGEFTASAATQAHFHKITQYDELLYDDKNQFIVKFKTEGTVTDPVVKPDFSSNAAAFKSKSKSLVESELNKEIEKLKKGGVLDKVNQAKEKAKLEFEKKKAELEAKKEQKKKEFEEKKKKEQEKAKKQLDEKKKKEEEKVKEKLKNNIKGKIPGL